MKLSLCIICKNEEQRIERCINSVKNYVDEMIVVDTGSTDKTIDIVKKLGAKVFEIEWEDDFSKARNYAISKAKGNWIIFLDADEYVIEEDRKYIRNYVIEAINKNSEGIMVEMINVDSEKVQSIFRPVRIFKRSPKIQYTGKIHELVLKEGKQMKLLNFKEPLRLKHDGYSDEVKNEKNKINRNLGMLLKEYEFNKESGNICYYLMETYYADGKLQEAYEFGHKVLEYNNGNLTGIKQITYSTLLQVYFDLKKTEKEMEKLYKDAVQSDPVYPDFDFRYGYYWYKKTEYKQAILYLEQSLVKIENYTGIEKSNVVADIVTLYRMLSHCYLGENMNHQAVAIFVKILRINKYEYESLFHLVRIVGETETPQALANFLYNIYDINNLKDHDVLKRIAQKAENAPLYEYIKDII